MSNEPFVSEKMQPIFSPSERIVEDHFLLALKTIPEVEKMAFVIPTLYLLMTKML